MNTQFWRGKRVFLTGHTGFKGSWFSLWLQELGAEVTGYALEAPTTPSLFERADVARGMRSVIGDVRDGRTLASTLAQARAEIIVHMAAQPLVRYSYENPVETYAVNVMGTVNLLEAVRQASDVRAVVVVTSDKCYANQEWLWGYRENEPLGGHDPYSSSKGCAELVTAAYRDSYFHPGQYRAHGVAVGSARAGNVIGGGDWAQDRLIPDLLRAIRARERARIRNPHAVRPWQHVLEPLAGYMLLAERLYTDGPEYASGWNFGPADEDAKPVEWIAQQLTLLWGEGAAFEIDGDSHPHEAGYLKLDCSKAKTALGWRPRWSLSEALRAIAAWHRFTDAGEDAREVCLAQISSYTSGEPLRS